MNIKPDMLTNLAEALHLNSRATQTFFLASLGIKDIQTIKQTSAPQDVLAELTQTLSQLQTPAYILDGFGTSSPLILAAWPYSTWKSTSCMPHIALTT